MKNNLLQVTGLVILLSSVVSSISAQDSARNLTLKDAIDLSLKNSKKLKGSQAKIEESTAALKEAVQRRLPEASIGGSYLYLTPPNINVKTKNNSSGSGSGGLNLGNIKISQVMYGTMNVSLPVYSGLKIQSGIESARFLDQATKLDADKDKEDIILNTVSAFVNLYKAVGAVILVKESLAESRKRVSDFSNLEKNGLLARNDLLKAELETSNFELSLLDAENNWKLANVNMNLMLGLPEKTALIPDSASLQTGGDLKDIDEYEQLAFQNRKDMQAYTYRQKAAAEGTKVARAEYYPSLALTGGYVALDIPSFISVTNAFTIGAGLKYNIGSLWKTDAKVQQAKAREQQLRAGAESLNDNIRFEINQAYENYILTQKKIDVYYRAIDQATENYKITKNKYDNNLLNTTDLLDADLASLQAKLNYAGAKADAVVAYNKLLQTAGLLSNPSGIKQ
jgi:outer membrane protein